MNAWVGELVNEALAKERPPKPKPKPKDKTKDDDPIPVDDDEDNGGLAADENEDNGDPPRKPRFVRLPKYRRLERKFNDLQEAFDKKLDLKDPSVLKTVLSRFHELAEANLLPDDQILRPLFVQLRQDIMKYLDAFILVSAAGH